MPQPLKIDWEAVKLAFVAGATIPEIADKFGVNRQTIASRAWRLKWNDLLPASRINHNDSAEKVADIWADRAQKHRETMATVTDKVAELALTMDPLTILGKADKVKIIDDIARRNYGLDSDSNPTISLAIGLLSNDDDMKVVSDFKTKAEALPS